MAQQAQWVTIFHPAEAAGVAFMEPTVILPVTVVPAVEATKITLVAQV
tara:strand:- start:287 stop:430 length:144 start_codon:yes stop_codon:yes gene_type:complete